MNALRRKKNSLDSRAKEGHLFNTIDVVSHLSLLDVFLLLLGDL